MERIWSTTTSDGEVFKGTDIGQVESEANAHELELSKKKQEAAERKRKEEAKRREKIIYINSIRNEIERQSKELLDNIKKYDEQGGEKRVDMELSLFGISYYRYFGDNSKELVRYLCNTVQGR